MKRHFQSGLSMIEILVTMVLIAGSSLALAGMQLAAVKYNKEASLRSVATLLAVEISDRMRSNIAGVKAGNYERNFGYTAATAASAADPGCGSTTDCTAATLEQLDIHNWQTSLTTALPGGAGAIIPSATADAYTIVVMWQDKSLSDAGNTDPDCTKPPLNALVPVAGVRCFTTTFMP